MKLRNVNPLLMFTAVAIATSGCQSGESLANNTGDEYVAIQTEDGDASISSPQYGSADLDTSGGNFGSDGSDRILRESSDSAWQTVTIVDQSGGGQPMEAGSISIPANWQAQGGIDWNRRVPCVGNQMRYQWQATSPDGKQAFTIMPGLTWQVQGTQSQMNPCPAMPFRSAQDLLSAVVQQQRPGARILQYQRRNRTGNGPGASRIDAGDMLVAYQGNGQEFREVFSTSVMFTESQGNVVGGASTVSTLRAPNGQLDFGFAEKIKASANTNQQWLMATARISEQSVDAYAGHQSDEISRWNDGRMAAINAKGAADRAAISSRSASEVAGINARTYANTSATDDEIQRRTLEGIGGFNTYSDPAGGNTVQADISYDAVIRYADGTYSPNNDPYYSPAGSVELERVQ